MSEPRREEGFTRGVMAFLIGGCFSDHRRCSPSREVDLSALLLVPRSRQPVLPPHNKVSPLRPTSY